MDNLIKVVPPELAKKKQRKRLSDNIKKNGQNRLVLIPIHHYTANPSEVIARRRFPTYKKGEVFKFPENGAWVGPPECGPPTWRRSQESVECGPAHLAEAYFQWTSIG
ncbi:unnamed protein product [Arctia plantaginis]|uniref:Uncharacterized protein n=1 Tax=Arctia plantaginis TaxID=874455 RepID=A0A8S1AFC8_ARCPL|nr:unnamed protein product [Arctia plantaginis]